MKRTTLLAGVFALCLTVVLDSAVAGVKTQAAREAAEFVMRKFGRGVAEEGVEKLSQKIEALAVRHGDDVFEAVRKVGPDALPLLTEAGEHAPQAARLLGRLGDDAVWVVKDQQRLTLFAKYGDEAAAAMIKHKEIAQPLIQTLDAPAAKALNAVDGRNARRLVIMAEEGELARLGRTDQLLGTVGRFGNRGMDFIWRNKGALAVTAALTAFLADPEPFIDGTKDLTAIVGQEVARPLVHEAAGSANWTLIGVAAVAISGCYVSLRMLVRRALRT